MWFVIWTVLVLGALGFFAYLGWRLWRRSVRPLLQELGNAAQVTGELAEKVAVLQEAQPEPRVTPDLFASESQREAFAQTRHDIRARRRSRADARRERAYARWRDLGQPF